MNFDWHMLYPLHTVILDNSRDFRGVPCRAQLCNFSKWFFSPRFGVVPIWELWQFWYVCKGPPKSVACRAGSRATRERRQRRICGGNRLGAVRRRLRGQTMPQPGTAASPMLCEDRDGGSAPKKQPHQDRSEAPGRWRQVAVATPASPQPHTPTSAHSNATMALTSGSVWAVGGRGYAADGSSLFDSALAAIKLLTYIFAGGLLVRGEGRGPLCCTLLVLLHARAHDGYAPLWPIIFRGARTTMWTAYRSAGFERTGGLGDQPTWPYLRLGMGHVYASLPALHPLPDSDHGMVWHHRCVYMPPECSH